MEGERPASIHAGPVDAPGLYRQASQSTVGTETGSFLQNPRISVPTRRRNRARNRNRETPWREKYDATTKMRGRCLVLDYIQREPGAITRKVDINEIHDLDSLQAFYTSNGQGVRDENVLLRVIHVQNWSDAVRFLAHKYRLYDVHSALTGKQGFVDWIMEKRPRRRAGKPLLSARTWKEDTDEFRRVSKCAVGLDLMKAYPSDEYATEDDRNPARVTGLMGYDKEDNPVHCEEVFSQRLCMYVQYALQDIVEPRPELPSPYHEPNATFKLDNGNTVIIFDNSVSHNIFDTLIPAQSPWEERWLKPPHYLAQVPDSSANHMENEDAFVSEWMRTITQDVFKAIAANWDEVLESAWEHVSILEAKIYEQPADESRAPELWDNQAKWLIFEKLMYHHQDAVNDLSRYLANLDGNDDDADKWLSDSPADFQRLTQLIEDDLLKRTRDLSDLLYKSVGIRDSRESLRLGASMWRLSWITFIFLPSNCIIAFFGMNVNILADNPPISWFFVACVPFFLLVFMLWWGLKYFFAQSRDVPVRRGAYEQLFSELQQRRPDAWTRSGPRENVKPKTTIGQWKWDMVLRWTTGDALPTPPTPDDEPIGPWNRMKRHFIRKWTDELVCEGQGAAPDDPEAPMTVEEKRAAAVMAAPRDDVNSGWGGTAPSSRGLSVRDRSDSVAESDMKVSIHDDRNTAFVEEQIDPRDAGPDRRRVTVDGETGTRTQDWAV